MGGALRVFRAHQGATAEENECKIGQIVRYKRKRSLSIDNERRITSNTLPIVDDGSSILLQLNLVNLDGAISEPLCLSILSGAEVEEAYGCHYHVYSSESPDESHGTALCWSLKKSTLSVHALISLGRLANSCRKDIVLFDDDVGISLTYTSTL